MNGRVSLRKRSLGSLRKLAGMSWAEISDRSRQGFSRKVEALGLLSGNKEKAQWSVLSAFANGKPESPQRLLEYFRSRSAASLYRSFEVPQRTVSILKERFPEHVLNVIAISDRISKGYFDLLGYKDLFFCKRIPDWHFEPVSGKTSPRVHWSKIKEVDAELTGDKKVIWELNRHQYFATLGQAYLITGDERYAQTFVEHLKNWCENNPPKIGVNWLSSLEIAFRSMSWIWALHFFKDAASFTEDALVKALTFLHLNGRHLETYLSTYFSPNTHLTGEALGLYFLGSFFPEFPEAKRWKKMGYQILLDTLDVHIADDGTYCEQSSHYARYTADFYSNLLILRNIQNDEVEAKHVEKLNSLYDYLLHISQSNGRTPLFGDEDGGRFLQLDNNAVNDFRPTLALGAVLLKRGDLKYAATDATPEMLWLLGPKELEKFDSLESRAPKELSKGFGEGGFYSARSSWAPDADQILIDCGPHGFLNGGHAHADALNVLLSLEGKPIFIDSGTFVYTSELASRDRFRSTEAHNCLTVDGQSSSMPNGVFSWRSIANAHALEWSDDGVKVLFRGEHDGFERIGVNYQRDVEFDRGGPLVVTDFVVSNDPKTFVLNFILAPDFNAEVSLNSVKIIDTSFDDRPVAMIETEVTGAGRVRESCWAVDDWQVSHCYGSAVPTKRLRFTFLGSGTISVTNRISKL